MKKVFIIGSRKFYKEIKETVYKLEKEDVKVELAEGANWDRGQEDTLKSEKDALLSAFNKMDKSDICYVYAKEGYVGKTASMEIAYAYARKKELISSEKIEELSAQALINKIMSPEEFIKYCKD